MSRHYDDTVKAHYKAVAESDGLSSASTMADTTIRETETDIILGFVNDVRTQKPDQLNIRVLEVGCGNGYTLGRLAAVEPETEFTGIEYSPELRGLAEKRVAEQKLANVSISAGDIRDPGFAGDGQFDALICQRVLINLLAEDDQAAALDNIVNSVKPGGALLFIEAFQSGLERLNEARAEWDLSEIPPAHHNLYLADDFFTRDDLAPYRSENWQVQANELSTHYFVSRVIYPMLLGDRPLKRNAHFMLFLTKALKTAVGEYAPVQFHAFQRL